MNLNRKFAVLQELIFQATVRGKSNWIRFPKDSKFHRAISHGQIPGMGLEHVRIVGDMCEVRA